MRRLSNHVTATVRRSRTTQAPSAWQSVAGRPRSPAAEQLRRFCAEAAAPTPRPKAKAKGGQGLPLLKVGGLGVVGVGVVYAASSDAQNAINEIIAAVGDMFEDFNDASREFFERIGDKFVSKKTEPWLLDLATMKYPENIPTLVLDLDKVILHLEHDSKQGWHVIKRPFADQFFKEISMYYEIVLFSDDVFPVALDIATKWNLPVTGVLHRDFCKKKRNHYVKDVAKLGRKLERVLIIDHDPAAFQWQPENGILIKPFEGDPNDSELADLLDFLKAAATTNGDIRQFVGKFGGGDEDLGRRYLIYKGEQDAKSEKRRNMGRAFGAVRGGGGFPSGGSGGNFGNFPR